MASSTDSTQQSIPLEAQPTAKLQPVAAVQAGHGGSHAVEAPGGEDRSGELRDAAPSEPPAAPAPRRRLRIRTWHVVAVVVALVLASLVAAAAFFMWDRWYRYDDSADIQGTWYAVGTDAPITITGDSIEFTPDTTYSYTLDPNAKSLSFSLGNLDGQAHYAFADDRNVLVIFDGEDYTRWGTAGDDLLRLLMDVSAASAGQAVHLPEGDGIIALSRTPFYGTSAPAQDGDVADSAAGAASDAGGSAVASGVSPAPSSGGAGDGDAADPPDSPQPGSFADVSDR